MNKRNGVFIILVLSLLLLNISCLGPKKGSTTEKEPNDLFPNAQSISVNGTAISGAINPAGDYDVYKFTGQVGYGYLVNVNWVSGESLDLYGCWYAYDYSPFYILDDTGAQGNETDTIDFHTVGGVCYLEISDATDSYTGQYTISVKKGSFGTAGRIFSEYNIPNQNMTQQKLKVKIRPSN